MVKGIERFREYFREFTEQYVLIGGAACDISFESNARMENTIPTAGMFTGNAVLNILMMSSRKVSKIGTGPCRIVSRCGERRSTCRRS